MMDKLNDNNSNDLKSILNQGTTPKPPLDFTNSLMSKIKPIAVRDAVFKNYLNRSKILISLSVILFFILLYGMSQSEALYSSLKNPSIQLAIQYLQYAFASASSIMILFQLNNLLGLQASERKTKLHSTA